MEFSTVAKYLIFLGILIFITGCFLYFLSKPGIGLGKLPGDILIQKDNFTFYFPLASSIIISIVLTLALSLFFRK